MSEIESELRTTTSIGAVGGTAGVVVIVSIDGKSVGSLEGIISFENSEKGFDDSENNGLDDRSEVDSNASKTDVWDGDSDASKTDSAPTTGSAASKQD